MRVHIVSGMYPTTSYPAGGNFVAERAIALRELGVGICLYSLVAGGGGFVSALRRTMPERVLGRPVKCLSEVPGLEVSFHPLPYQEGLVTTALARLGQPDRLVRQVADVISAGAAGTGVRPDVLHAHWGYPAGVATVMAGRDLGIPAVVTCHGSDINVVARNSSIGRIMARELSRAACVEFVSTALRDAAMSLGVRPGRSVVVPNGVRCTERPGGARARGRSPKRVGYVGTLLPIKGADLLPDIIRCLYAHFEAGVEIEIIGDGPLRPELELAVQGLPVRFLGQIPHDQVLGRMQQMDLLIIPSRNEGWPCVILEAHSVGTPVVGVNVGGVAEAIGDPNLVVPAGTCQAQDLARLAARVLRGEINVASTHLIERARGYTWRAMARRTRGVYEALAGTS